MHEVSLDLVHRVGVSAFVDMLSGRGQMVRVSKETAARLAIARLLRNHVPARVSVDQAESTVDTPENRFVKTFLQSAQGIIERMRQAIREDSQGDIFTNRILHDCDLLEKKLMPLVRHSVWNHVGPMVHLPAASTVLHRRRGYRQVFHHFSKLRLAARVPLRKELARDLLEGKDIAHLYELWAFFQVVRALKDLLGRPDKADSPQIGKMQVKIPFDFEVAWRNGIRVRYNSRFSRQSHDYYSYSLPLRPDITLHVPCGQAAGLHFLDAKFRLQRLDEIIPLDETEDETEEASAEQRGTFKRDDLCKMHTYRDAIPTTRSVWVLYPGSEMRFYGTDGTRATPARPGLGNLQGVGAIPLLPNQEQNTQLRQVLAELVRDFVR